MSEMLRCCFGLALLVVVCSLSVDAAQPWSPLGTRGKRSPFGMNIEHLLNEKRSPYGMNMDSLLEDKRSPYTPLSVFDHPIESKRSPYGLNLDGLINEKRSPYGLNLDGLINEKRSPFGMNMGQLLDEKKRSPFGLEIGSLLGDKRNWEDSERGAMDLENEKRSPFRLNRIGAVQAPSENKRSPFRLSRMGAIQAGEKRASLATNQDPSLTKVMNNRVDPATLPAYFRVPPATVANALSELNEKMEVEREIRTLAKRNSAWA